jgi:dihydrofolate synthase/folylpolyglutamate synthase
MRQLLTRLGQPHAGLRIIHVAGTKGKGSTSAMIAAMLTAAGYRTGVFSSPHLYFDVTTAMALLHFVERQVDAAVLEVGLGGRLDSTNVCLPVVSVITSISFDHMKQLGNTLGAIAREKAGIIKPGVPVICGVTQPEPQAVIAEVAREHGCRLIQLGADFKYEYAPSENCGAIDFAYNVPSQEFELHQLTLGMRGPHQAANAAVALAAIAELRHQGWCISSDAVGLGLSRASLPGRVEVVPGEPMVVLDTAHNPASARALIAALAEMPPASRRTLILSISHDKDVPAIVNELAPHFDRFVITQYQENPRAVAACDLAEIMRDTLNASSAHVHIVRTPRDAWLHVCQTAIPHERVCITGSFYLAAEMRRLVLKPLAANVGPS